MAGERAAADAIAAAFADPEPLLYSIDNGDPFPISAIRHEQDAGEGNFSEGRTLRRIAYEVQFSALADKPTKRDTFVHRSILWRIENIRTLDDVFAWDLDVVNGGEA